MSEYEIFNNGDENIEIVPEPKKPKKEKKSVVQKEEKKECKVCVAFKDWFKFSYVPAILALVAIFFGLFVQFFPLIGLFTAAAAFLFIGFTFAMGAIITEAICMSREGKFVFNVKVMLIVLAFFVICI
jgi:uncharacterized membrane protein YphA (DoxX/SURF4 family)